MLCGGSGIRTPEGSAARLLRLGRLLSHLTGRRLRASRYARTHVQRVRGSADACPLTTFDTTVVIGSCDSGAPDVLLPNGCSISQYVNSCTSGGLNRRELVSCVSASAKDAAELMAECSLCGAITEQPLELAWEMRHIACSNCGVVMRIDEGVLTRLREQAVAALSTIKALPRQPH